MRPSYSCGSRKNSCSVRIMDALREWVDHHMKEKSSEDLWYLSEEILMELSGRDSIKYRIIEDKVEITHDSEGC